jgi:hypothetical protein
MKSVCLSVFFFLPQKKTLLTRIITMDVGRESDNDDAVDGELNPIDQKNGDDEVQYGYRWSRWRTSYEYQGSSLLKPTQIMEQETYYRYAEIVVQRVSYLLQLILLHQALYVSLRATIGQWSGIAGMAEAIVSAREKMQKIMNVVTRLFFIARWIRTHGEIALLYAEDLTVFIRRRHLFGPHCFRRIVGVPYQDCYTWFGQYPHNLRHLYVHLRVPDSFTSPMGQVYGGEECFLIYLYHLMKGTPFTEMARFVFGGDPRHCRR